MKKQHYVPILFLALLLVSGIVYSKEPLPGTVNGRMQGNDFVVSIENVANVAGYQVDITFNPSVFKFTEISYGDFLKQNDVETFKVPPNTDTPGLIKAVAEARTGRVAGADGSGVLFTARFEKIGDGDAGVKISYSKIVDTEGIKIDTTVAESENNKIDTTVAENESPNIIQQTAPSISTEMLLVVVIVIVVLVWAVFMRKNNK